MATWKWNMEDNLMMKGERSWEDIPSRCTSGGAMKDSDKAPIATVSGASGQLTTWKCLSVGPAGTKVPGPYNVER